MLGHEPIRGEVCLLGVYTSKRQRKTKRKNQIVCIRTIISNITSISKPSVAFSLKELYFADYIQITPLAFSE